jgi:DnaJ-class molecular chaperone
MDTPKNFCLGTLYDVVGIDPVAFTREKLTRQRKYCLYALHQDRTKEKDTTAAQSKRMLVEFAYEILGDSVAKKNTIC